MRRLHLTVGLVAAMSVVSSAIANAPTFDEQFAAAVQMVAAARASAQTDEAASRLRAKEAAIELSMLCKEPLAPLDRAVVLTQLGTAERLAGDAASSILAFRRALLLDPVNDDAIAGLAHARAVIAPSAGADTPANPSISEVKDATAFDRAMTRAMGYVVRWVNVAPPFVWTATAAAGLVILSTLVSLRFASRGQLRLLKPAWITGIVAFVVGSAGFVIGGLPDMLCVDLVVVADGAKAFDNPQTGGAGGKSLLKGAEVGRLEHRTANGRQWLRVRPISAETLKSDALWVVSEAVEPVATKFRTPWWP